MDGSPWQVSVLILEFASVLWCCWLGSRKETRPVKSSAIIPDFFPAMQREKMKWLSQSGFRYPGPYLPRCTSYASKCALSRDSYYTTPYTRPTCARNLMDSQLSLCYSTEQIRNRRKENNRNQKPPRKQSILKWFKYIKVLSITYLKR